MNLPNTDLHLITVKLDELRPTQITVGFREVNAKRAHWQVLDKKGRAAAIDSHWFPPCSGRSRATTWSIITTLAARGSKNRWRACG